eukprot:scaffold2030_cov585-Pavlova_lutheri.AAC.1
MERPAGTAYASTGDAMDQTNATTGFYVLENGWMQKFSVVGVVAKELEEGRWVVDIPHQARRGEDEEGPRVGSESDRNGTT